MDIITQDEIKYKVDNGVLKGWKGQSPFTRPKLEDGVIVEGWTAEDDVIEEAATQRNLLLENITADETVGKDLTLITKIIVNERKKDKSITKSEYKQLKRDLKETLGYLKDGDWDSAQTEVITLTSANETIQSVYADLKSEIDTYLV